MSQTNVNVNLEQTFLGNIYQSVTKIIESMNLKKSVLIRNYLKCDSKMSFKKKCRSEF